LYKVLKIHKSRNKKVGVKKPAAPRRSKRFQETPSSMPSGRVFADALGATKMPLEVVDELPPKRVSRRSATEVSATNHEDTPLRNNHRSSAQMDEGSQSMDEGSTMRRGPSPTASAGRGHEHFDYDGFLDPEVEFSDAGKFSFGELSTLSSAFVIFLDSFGCVLFSDMIFACMPFRCNRTIYCCQA
jgi:hypothetical protein